MCVQRAGLCLKIEVICLHPLRISWSAYEPSYNIYGWYDIFFFACHIQGPNNEISEHISNDFFPFVFALLVSWEIYFLSQ